MIWENHGIDQFLVQSNWYTTRIWQVSDGQRVFGVEITPMTDVGFFNIRRRQLLAVIKIGKREVRSISFYEGEDGFENAEKMRREVEQVLETMA